MKNIVIKIKPESISYDDIHTLISSAHSKIKKKGMNMKTASLTGEQLKERIGKDGICIVALDNKKLVGTLSIRFVERNTWYAKGIVPEYILAAVLPSYQGMHITSKLFSFAFDITQSLGYNIIELDTAEKNYHAINIYQHLGFRKVNFASFKNVDHYSVFMVKWLNNCPYSQTYCYCKFLFRKILIKIRYKVGGTKRFGI